MKRSSLPRHLRRHGCAVHREGREHTIWINLNSHQKEPVPHHNEIKNQLARKICRRLGVPDPLG